MRFRLLASYFGPGGVAFAGTGHQGQDFRNRDRPGWGAIVGATVLVTNTETNVSTPLTTNASGYYLAPLLPGGQYQVTVEAPGFKKIVRPSLILKMSGQIKIDITMEVGAVNESITITAESPILDTSTVTTARR